MRVKIFDEHMQDSRKRKLQNEQAISADKWSKQYRLQKEMDFTRRRPTPVESNQESKTSPERRLASSKRKLKQEMHEFVQSLRGNSSMTDQEKLLR